MHSLMHTKRSESNFWFKCLKPNCKSTFQYQLLLDLHMRIHNNQLDKCQYCPYHYLKPHDYSDHLNKHFRIKNYKCDHCDLTFTTKKVLVVHSSMHEGIVYCCLICETYESNTKNSMQMHLRNKHSDFLGKHLNWNFVKEYVKVK